MVRDMIGTCLATFQNNTSNTKVTDCGRQRCGSVLCVSFMREKGKTRVIRLRVIEGSNARDKIAFCAFHSFLVEVQTTAGYIHATHA